MIHYTTSRRIFTSPQLTEIGPFSFRFFLKSLCGNADFNPARYFGMDRSNGKNGLFFLFFHPFPVSFQNGSQILAGVALFAAGDLLRGAGGYDLSAAVAALGTQIN